MNAVKKLVTRSLVTVVVVAASLGLAVTPALAGSPIVYRQAGNHWTPIQGLPNTSPNYARGWAPPGNPFHMECYIDSGYNYYGNYWSHRWFQGYSQSGIWGYVHSSYVYYQVWVPRC